MGKPEVILLDTHVVLWLAFGQVKISKRAKAAIEEAPSSGDGLGIAGITLLEIATLEKKRSITVQTTLETFLSEVEARFVVLPITGRMYMRAIGLLASFPSDPADCLIAATALVEGIPLVTADDEIRRSKAVTAIW
jgi:PIN domain nuclease of toxin-antitoxin system